MVEIPGYRVEHEIGRGGMANVYLAVQESVERRVALKIMSPVLLVDPTFSERFMLEARIAANLTHPSIIAVHDVGLHQDHHYIAMELMDGGDLASRCSRGYEQGAALQVIRDIASALHYAHEKGFVHRDVKPENILFRESGTAVLTDFGIARAVDAATRMTKTGAVIGTPQYMSPEQARGQVLDGRSDMYGLGIVLFEVLTGKVPFEGADSISVGIKHVTEPIPQLPNHMSHLQPLLNGFLAKEVENRFQTGDEAVVAIDRVERGDPIKPLPKHPPGGLDATRVGGPSLPSPADETAMAPMQVPKRGVHVSATPKPDGTLRREPTLGSIDEIKSFDRTMSQPQMGERRRRGGAGVIIVVLVIGLAVLGWWQRDLLQPLLQPLISTDPGIIDLLERGVEAEANGRHYGQGERFASHLFSEALRKDPGNVAAGSGLDRVARYLVDRAGQAVIDGNPQQADLLLDRARELSPEIADAADLSARKPDPVVQTPAPEPAPPEPEPRSVPRVDPGVDQLAIMLTDAMDFVRRDVLVGPGENNAAARFRKMLAMDPDNPAALSGLDRIAESLRGQIESALQAELPAKAEALITDLVRVIDDAVELQGYRREVSRLWDLITERERIAEDSRNRIGGLLQLGASALSADRLGAPVNDNAIDHYREVLRIDAGNTRARDGLVAVSRRYLALTEMALEDDRLDQADQFIEAIESLTPDLPGLDRARRRLALYRGQRDLNQLTVEQQVQLKDLLVQAAAAYDRNELLSPPGASAFDLYKSVLRLDPRDPEATAGLRQVSGRLIDRSRESLRAGDLSLAFAWLGDARQTDPQNPMLAPLANDVSSALRFAVQLAIDEARLDEAGVLLRRASDLEPEHPDLGQLQLRLNIARE